MFPPSHRLLPENVLTADSVFYSHTTRHTALANQPPQIQFLALHLLASNVQAAFPPSGLLLGVFQGTSCILTLRVAAPEKRMLLAVTTKAI